MLVLGGMKLKWGRFVPAARPPSKLHFTKLPTSFAFMLLTLHHRDEVPTLAIFIFARAQTKQQRAALKVDAAPRRRTALHELPAYMQLAVNHGN